MTKLEGLMCELCPKGVDYKMLSDVLKIRNGSDYKKFPQGEIPVYGSGGIIAYIDRYACDKPSVLIPRKGSIDKLYYVDVPFWTVDTIFYTEINTEVIEPKFVFYYLQNQHLEMLNTAGGVPSLTQKVLNKVPISVPPLEVQREIVRILDTFTELTVELTTELTTELTARKKQYIYYRNYLLDIGDKVDSRTLGELCEISAGGDVPKDAMSKDKTKNFNIPIVSNGIGANAIYGYTNITRISSFAVTVAARGTIGYAEYRDYPYYPIIRLLSVIPKDYNVLNPKYLYYCLQGKKYKVPASGIPQLTAPMLKKEIISVPTMDVQNRIVKTLDNFDAMCTDLNIGLLAEIEERQKQYEYYRDKLLSFKELNK